MRKSQGLIESMLRTDVGRNIRAKKWATPTMIKAWFIITIMVVFLVFEIGLLVGQKNYNDNLNYYQEAYAKLVGATGLHIGLDGEIEPIK